MESKTIGREKGKERDGNGKQGLGGKG